MSSRTEGWPWALALYSCADPHRAVLPKTKNAKELSRRTRVKAEECGRKAGLRMRPRNFAVFKMKDKDGGAWKQ